MANDDREQPIEDRTREIMNSMAKGIDEVLNGDKQGEDRDWCFALFVFPANGNEGRFNYISSADRGTMLTVLEEQAARIRAEMDSVADEVRKVRDE